MSKYSKIRPDDEGSLDIAISSTIRDDGEEIIVIDFGKKIDWIGMPKKQAADFAMNILRRSVDRYISMKFPDPPEKP